MPYETRGGKLSAETIHGERFSRSTWIQTDFLNAEIRLPFSDGFFDFAYCGQMLGDLDDPQPLLRAFARVALAERVVSPSHLAEQTLGVRDRACRAPGHPHHRWILGIQSDKLVFCRKQVSLAASGTRIPLTTFEHVCAFTRGAHTIDWSWQGPIKWRISEPDEAVRRSREAVANLRISRTTRWRDHALRAAGRIRNCCKSQPVENPGVWWQDMLNLSRPYSSVPI